VFFWVEIGDSYRIKKSIKTVVIDNALEDGLYLS
jgi:hypothetical protein